MNTLWRLPVLLLLALHPLSARASDDSVVTAPTPQVRKALRVAVYDLEVSGIDERVAHVFTESLMAELRKLERTSVIGLDEIRAMLDLEAQKQLVGCAAETSCLAEIADALGADVLVLGSIARVGESHAIALKAVMQKEAAARGTFNKVVPAGNGEELLAEIGPAITTLFPDIDVRAGLTRGVALEQARRLSPPPLPPWAFWTGVGTSAALAAGAGVAGTLQLITYGQYRALIADAETKPVSGALIVQTGESAVIAEQVGWGLLGGAVAVAALTAIAIPFVDFDNLAEDMERTR